MGPLCNEKEKAGGQSERHSCKTSDHVPLTFIVYMYSLVAFSPLVSFTLSDSELISFLFNLAPSPPMSPFRQGGPESVPVAHRIAAVHHSWQLCLLPEIYIIFARGPASMSDHKVTEH